MRILQGKKISLLVVILMGLFITSLVLAQNQTWLPRPISLGTSGGNINDINRSYCCSGTLGALTQDTRGNQYILSNNHILARTNKGVAGDDIIQPGLIDQNPVCYKDYNDAVADLSTFVPISFKRGTTNTVDGAIASVRSGAVNQTGYILDIGEVSSFTADSALNMPVKKSGRTTDLTAGTITAVNATVKVTYNKTCGIGSQTATFVNQLVIGTAGFSAGGDSGSLVVEDCSFHPRAVGLLFAGSNTVTIANPIDYVLTSLGVSMVGAVDYCQSTVSAGGTTMGTQSQLPPQADERAVDAARRVKERHEEAILRIEGVVGTGIGFPDTAYGQVVIKVFSKRPAGEIKHMVPETLEGIPVEIVETGEIIAF